MLGLQVACRGPVSAPSPRADPLAQATSAVGRRRQHGLGSVRSLGVTYAGTHATGTSATITLVQTAPTTDISGTSLNILKWSHFVPAFDEWFPQFLQE